MRRIFSITAIVALMSPVASPLLAASCPHAQQAPACHRTQPAHAAHHCDAMTHHHEDETAAPADETPALTALQATQNCPMDCCVAGGLTTAVAVAGASVLPALTVTDQAWGRVSVPFISAGFSSHTDRGPPNR